MVLRASLGWSMVWFETSGSGVVVGLWGFLGSAWDFGVFYGMQGFLLHFSVFSWIFLFCSGGSGVLSHGADSGLGSMVEFDL